MSNNRRVLTQVVSSATLVALWLLTASPLKFPVPANSWLRLDPLLALGNSLATRQVSALFWPAVAMLLVAVVWGRIFCWWACPVGALLDLQTRLLRRFGYRSYLKVRLPELNLVVLSLTLVAAAAGFGAVQGLVDPLVFVHRALTFLRAGRLPEILLIVLGLGFLAPRLWCRFLCPLGGLLGAVNLPTNWLGRRRRAERVAAKVGAACSKGETAPGKASCAGAGKASCADCPSGYSRRTFLGLLGGALAAQVALPKPATAAGESRFLRPPGSLSETRFSATCVRCGECIKVCPTRGLLPAFAEAGLEGIWTPHLVPRVGECKGCMLCGKVCPAGALRPIPLALMKLGTAEIDHGACWAWNGTRACKVCVDKCPKRIVRQDEQGRPFLDAAACDGCGKCEKYCPVKSPAIVVFSGGERRRDTQGQGKDAADATVREEL